MRELAAVFLVLSLAACQPAYRWDGSIEHLLRAQPDRFGTIMADPELHRVQVIYTQIDRDAENRPSFRSYTYRLDVNEYYYPASTVKLPTAALALEKLRELGIAGLGRDTAMLTGSSAAYQEEQKTDDTAPGGRPSVGHYVRKILLVSDNDAFNRLYEFLGQQELNETLEARDYHGTRIVHRLEVSLTPEENRFTNPVRFVGDDGTVLYEQEARLSDRNFLATGAIPLGRGEFVDGELLSRPKDFAEKNAYPLQALHDTVRNIVFPDSAPEWRRFRLEPSDREFLLQNMSGYPGESGIAAYGDRGQYPDGYVKFLMFGGGAAVIPSHIRIFNKVGDAYGFLTDAAYIVDFRAGLEFLLAATVYVNSNETFNDDNYEYESIGLPFLRDLGRAFYEIELERAREFPPNLGGLHFSSRQD